jgi:hypothetical protein
MRETQVGLGGRFEPLDADPAAERVERSLHEPEVDRADDLAVFVDEVEERAVPQPDLARARARRGLGFEAEFVEQRHGAGDRVGPAAASARCGCGCGSFVTEAGAVPLSAGRLVWLPRRSSRSITAGEAGLSYLSVHPRRPGLAIRPAAPRDPADL